MNFSINSTTISYSHSAFPSYVGVAPTVVVGEVFSLSAVQKIDRQWQLAETANYAHRSGGSGLNTLTFDSYSASVDIYFG